MNGMNGGMAGMEGGMMGGMEGGMNGSNGANGVAFAPQLVFEIKIGDVFALKKDAVSSMNRNGMGTSGMGGNNGLSGYYDEDENQAVVEFYQLLDVTPSKEEDGKPVIRVQKLTGQFGAAEGEPIVLSYKDTVDYVKAIYGTPEDEPNHDYAAPSGARGNAGGTGVGGGMDAGMGMSPMGGMMQ